MLTADARPGASAAARITRICSGGTTANVAMPHTSSVAAAPACVAASTGNAAIDTINSSRKPIRLPSSERSARRPPATLPIEKPTPISTSIAVTKPGVAPLRCSSVGATYVYSVNIAPAPSTVVASAPRTTGRVNTASSARKSGILPASPFGSAANSPAIAISPSAAVAANDIRQPMMWPSHVAAGTPPTFAIVRPMNIVATALACLSRGTRLAATTEPSPKNAPWFRLVTRRASSSVV